MTEYGVVQERSDAWGYTDYVTWCSTIKDAVRFYQMVLLEYPDDKVSIVTKLNVSSALTVTDPVTGERLV